MAASSYHRPESLELTTNPEANRLIARDPAAFLIGWILDQQIKVQQAFAGPLELQRRIGSIDPAAIAAMPEDAFIEAFTRQPTLHRYGGSVGRRVRDCMQTIVDAYDGDAERVWIDVEDYTELKRRLLALPGFGPTKAPAVAAMLARRFGLPITGFEHELFPYGSLSEVVVYEDLVAYQQRKSEFKQAKRAAAAKA